MSTNQIDNNNNTSINSVPILPSEEEKARKYQQYFTKMKEREDTRKAKIEDRKSNQIHSSQANETSDYFWKEFKEQRLELEQILNNFEDTFKSQTIMSPQLIQVIYSLT